MTRDELLVFQDLIVLNQCKKIVEIGVWTGESAAFLCRSAMQTGGHVWGFDWWEPTGLINLKKRHKATQSRVARGLNQEVAREYLANQGIPESVYDLYRVNTIDELSKFDEYLRQNCSPIDFCFIDGCHSYAGVSNDFWAVYKYLSPTGIIAFHDTIVIDGCREFVLDLRSKYYDGTYDIVDFPFGHDTRNCGVTLLVKRCYHKIGRPMDEVCNLEDRRGEIEAKERAWYESQEQLYKHG